MANVASHTLFFRPEARGDGGIFKNTAVISAPSKDNQPTDMCAALFESILSKVADNNIPYSFAKSSNFQDFLKRIAELVAGSDFTSFNGVKIVSPIAPDVRAKEIKNKIDKINYLISNCNVSSADIAVLKTAKSDLEGAKAKLEITMKSSALQSANQKNKAKKALSQRTFPKVIPMNQNQSLLHNVLSRGLDDTGKLIIGAGVAIWWGLGEASKLTPKF
jgi:hypothetical protein